MPPTSEWTLKDWQAACATACEVGAGEIDGFRLLLLEINRLATVVSLASVSTYPAELDTIKQLTLNALKKYE
ncbi:hypothetical protein [Bradyrhizobium tunisiense]|uniref:hypothetical protein n=1 Tax=Bradyrhizobium tunisiense TaxID=3278709 RepID=UPI0035DA11F5